MRRQAQVGLALAGGYLLGRTKKLKVALALGGLAAGRRMSTDPGQLLKRGADALRSSPQVGQLMEQARGGLFDAGKAAAVAAASSRLESVSNSMAQRAATVAGGGSDRSAGTDEQDEADEKEQEQEEPQEQEREQEPQEQAETDEEKPKRQRRSPRRRSETSSSSGSRSRSSSRGRTSSTSGSSRRRGESRA